MSCPRLPFLGSVKNSPWRRAVCHKLRLEAEPAVAPYYVAGGWTGEMSSEHMYRLVAISLHELLPRFDRELRICIELYYPIRVCDLNRMMHHVTGDDSVLTAR
jgi:hypothetical protein